jgi:hypothetical protein
MYPHRIPPKPIPAASKTFHLASAFPPRRDTTARDVKSKSSSVALPLTCIRPAMNGTPWLKSKQSVPWKEAAGARGERGRGFK